MKIQNISVFGHRGIEPLNRSALNQVYLERGPCSLTMAQSKPSGGILSQDQICLVGLMDMWPCLWSEALSTRLIYKWLLEERLNYLKTVGATQSTVIDDGPK